jgi:N-acetylglutamate synthase-like GNAT family acetyltransferase
MHIRTAAPEDLPRIRTLLSDAGLPLEGLDEQFGPGYAVAVEDDKVVGAAAVERYGRWGLLRSVVTDPDWRRRGVGETLTRNRLAWAETEGLEGVYLLTTTAASYFPRLGFAQVNRDELPLEIRESTEFSSACPSSAVAMRCLLPQS